MKKNNFHQSDLGVEIARNKTDTAHTHLPIIRNLMRKLFLLLMMERFNVVFWIFHWFGQWKKWYLWKPTQANGLDSLSIDRLIKQLSYLTLFHNRSICEENWSIIFLQIFSLLLEKKMKNDLRKFLTNFKTNFFSGWKKNYYHCYSSIFNSIHHWIFDEKPTWMKIVGKKKKIIWFLNWMEWK